MSVGSLPLTLPCRAYSPMLMAGPGRHLSYGLYPGNTIFRETFETQFVQARCMHKMEAMNLHGEVTR
jgi:hypothetical protein